MKAIKNSLNINETYTKLYRRPKPPASEQNHIKDNAYLVKGYNYMADVLHLPVDSFGYCKLLVVCDIADDSFDIEKLKDSESAPETLKAYKRMLLRGIIELPKASLTTDGGSGFKADFHKMLYNNGIDHRVARVGRHHQLANVDNLCRQLGDIFHGIMNAKEEQTGKRSVKWTYMIDIVRDKLNAYRKKKLPVDITTYQYPFFDNTIKSKNKIKIINPKYKVGDLVNVLLQEPLNALGKKQPSKQFRMGDYRLDKKKRKILAVLYYAGHPSYRYLIEGLPNASYTEQELKQI